MKIFVLTLAVFLLAALGLAIGVLRGRPGPTGSCAGAALDDAACGPSCACGAIVETAPDATQPRYRRTQP